MNKLQEELKLICDKCGGQPPIVKEKSNKNWTVYKNGNCPCGGSYKFRLVELSNGKK